MSSLSRKSCASKSQIELSLDTPLAWVVYVLCDSRSDDPIKRIRYVGVTHGTAERRLSEHISDARSKGRRSRTYKANWIRQLLAVGLSPIVETVDVGTAERAWDGNEMAWIRHYRNKGCPLTNGTDGGEGVVGHVMSDEAKAKSTATRKDRIYVVSQETREKLSTAHKAFRATPEGRASLLVALELAQTPEARAKRSASVKETCARPDVYAKRSAAQKAMWSDPEQRAKREATNIDPERQARRSAASKAAWKDPDRRAQQSVRSKTTQADPEYRVRQSEIAKAVTSSPEVRAHRSDVAKALWDDPEFRAKMAAIRTDPDYRARLSASKKAAHERRGKEKQ